MSLFRKNDLRDGVRPAGAGANANGGNGYGWVAAAFLVPMLAMWIGFALCKVHPFGDMQMLYSDLREQYYPFLQEFQARVRSGDSLLWSWNGGLGTDFWALIGYYAASPLNLLTIPFTDGPLRDLMAFFLTVKIGCAGGFFALMLRKIFKRTDFSTALFGWMYAFCSFIMGYYWDVIWMDTVALVPLIFLGLYRLVTEGKFRLYVISLALAVLANYYIGVFVCLFCVLAFFALCAVKQIYGRNFLARLGQFSLSSLLGGGMTMFLLLHAGIALGYTDSASGGASLDPEFYDSYTEVLGNLLAFNKPTAMEGLPNLYCTVLPLLLAAVFFRSRKISVEEKILHGLFLGFFIFATNFNILDYVLHGFHFPNMLPARYSFLISFVLILMGYRAFLLLREFEWQDMLAIAVLGAGMLVVSSFGMTATKLLGNVVLFCAYFLFFFLYQRKYLTYRVFCVFLSLLLSAELISSLTLSMDTVGKSSYVGYPYKKDEITEVNQTLESLDDRFWRTEMTCRYYLNDGMFYHYRGIGQFSSTANRNVRDLMSGLAFTTGANSYYFNLSTPLTNSVLGLKYLISRSGEIMGGTATSEYFKQNGLTVYRNDAFLGAGYMADWETASFSFTNSPFRGQNELFKALTGTEDAIFLGAEEDAFTSQNFASLEKTGSGTYSYSTDDREGTLEISYTAPRTGTCYAYLKVGGGGDITVTTSAGNVYSHPVAKLRYITPLCEVTQGDTVTLTVTADAKADNKTISVYFYSFDQETFDAGWENLSDETWDPVLLSDTHLKGDITVRNDGLFCTSIPYTRGWKLYVDKKEHDIQPVLSDAFIGAALPEGTHTVELIYEPEGFTAGCVISAASLLVFLVLVSLFRKGFPLPKPKPAPTPTEPTEPTAADVPSFPDGSNLSDAPEIPDTQKTPADPGEDGQI